MDILMPSPETTLLILLGASAWPFSPEFQRSEAFATAARRVKAYFLHAQPFGLPDTNLLDLFDSDKTADELDVAIGRFLDLRLAAMKAAHMPARDLVLYFVGHGGFVGRDADFYLAIRRTRMDNPRASGLQMMSLADTLTERARHLRRIIILDCCFAAAAFSAFQAAPDQLAMKKVADAFEVRQKTVGIPTKGTTLLCSSSHKSPSLILPDGSSTMFTKALVDALIHGTASEQERLSLREVKNVAMEHLDEIRDAPRPAVLSPDQSEGDVADVPFFPNPWMIQERRRLEEERCRHAEEEHHRQEAAEILTHGNTPPQSEEISVNRSSPSLKARQEMAGGWSIGTQQGVSMLFGSVIFGIAAQFEVHTQLAGLPYSFRIFPAIIILLFFGVVFGPWVGLFSGAAGYLVEHSITNTPLVWYQALALALIGMIAGVATLRTNKQSSWLRMIFIAEVFCLIAIVIGLACGSFVGIVTAQYRLSDAVGIFIGSASTDIILGLGSLPLLLMAYAQVAKLLKNHILIVIACL